MSTRTNNLVQVTLLANQATGFVIAMIGSAGSAGGRPINYLELEDLLGEFLADFNVLPERWKVDEPIFTSATPEALKKWFGIEFPG